MRARLTLLALAAGLALAAPALAQDARTAQLAERYGVEGWPASAPARAGLDPARILPPGWTQLALERDALRAEARVDFGPAEGPARLQLVLRRHETSAAARTALLQRLGTVQRTLAQRHDVGDLAFATPGPKPSLLEGTWGNLQFTLRPLEAGAYVTPLLPTLDAALRASLAADDPEAPPAPRLLGVEPLDGPEDGAGPTRFALVLDPATPAPAALAFRCSGDASVLALKEGYALYPAGPGAVEVTVTLLGADLRPSEHRVQLTPR